MKTLEEILIDVSAVLDLEAELPSGDELTLRINYANQAIWDAADVGQLSEFRREYIANTSTLATLPLPADFRELEENPRILVGGSWIEWPEIEPKEKYKYSPAERFCYVMGDPKNGYNLILNNPEPFATISIIYQKTPEGFATLSDICELPSPSYVARKIESYVLYSRGSEKYPEAENRAAIALQNMFSREMKTAGGQVRKTPVNFNNPLK